MDEEENVNEDMSKYSDRQIVATLIGELSGKDLEIFLTKLKRDWG